MTDRKYYLNNFSNEAITIQLSTKRTIAAKASLPLNNKDVAMFKVLKAKRTGLNMILNDLRLSTMPIEEDSNYTKVETKESEEALKEELESQANKILETPEAQSVKDFLEGETDELPEDTTEISNEEAANLEAQAMAELEAGIQEEQPTEETPVEQPTEEAPIEQPAEDASKSNKRGRRQN